MSASKSLTACLADTFVAPTSAVDAAREHGRWLWVPLLLVIVAGIAVWSWYYQTVDFAWLSDHLLGAADLSGNQLDAARERMSPTFSLGIAIAGAIPGTFLVYTLQTTYLLLAARMSGNRDIGFGKWFSLTAWTRLPNLLAILAMAIAYGLADSNQIGPAALNVLSLNALLFHFPLGHAAFSLANSITLTSLWSLGLLTLGLMRWLNRSAFAAIAIVFAPYVIFYGIWLAIKLA